MTPLPQRGGVMAVRPETIAWKSPTLSGTEGELVSVSISVEPRALERLLDTLATLDFPVNPQLFHSAAIARIHPDGHEELEPTTLVEFPAYANRLEQIREALHARGLDPASVWARSMLEEIHTLAEWRPAPPGAPYSKVVRYRRPATAS